MNTRLRAAREADADAIAALVNRAYRPAAPEQGWTHESDLVSGDRISSPQVLALFRPHSAVLVLEANGRIVACVHVEMIDGAAWIGMLATEPGLQAQGLGKRMLHDAEQCAMERFQATTFRMSVVSQRPALLAFYERRGYMRTGEVLPYPVGSDVGTPRVEGLRLIALRKDTTAAAHRSALPG